MLFYSLLNYFILLYPSTRAASDSVLLVRLDAIGDFVLFHNFIELLSLSSSYGSGPITLVGNKVWKSLAEETEKNIVDKFIWLDREKFSNNLLYRLQKLKEIRANSYETVINSEYSRELLFSDSIVRAVSAEYKIGSVGDCSNQQSWQKIISDKFYTQLVSADPKIMFEFDRNKEFFSFFIDTIPSDLVPNLNCKMLYEGISLPDHCAVISIGAGSSFRKWCPTKFARVAQYLRYNYHYEIVLCGSDSDIDDSKEFLSIFGHPCINYVGKTSLIEYILLLQQAELLVSNESSGPHLAVALNIQYVFVVSNGNHFGRFNPYPQDITQNYRVVYPPIISKVLDKHAELSQKYGRGSDLNMSDITADIVIETIDAALQ